MDDPRQLNLNCVIEGEYGVFPVTVGHDCVTGTLREKIKQECAVTFKDVDAYTLELWKVNVNLNDYDEPSLSNLRLGDLEGIKKLTWEPVSELWSDQPSTAFLHIIVKAPTTERPYKRTRLSNSPPQVGMVEVKSSPPRLSRQETEDKMAAAFAGFETYIESLASGKLDVYLDLIKREDRLTDLDVILDTGPILLIHDLGKHPDHERIKGLFTLDGYNPVHLFNVSGSGKTRLSLDGLCFHWGLYISCATGSPASGSDDFTVVTEALQSMSTWDQGKGSANISENISAARRTFTMMLCARFFILKQLVQHIPVNTDVTVAQRRWVLAQALPPRLRFGDELFVKVLRVLQRADTDVMLDIVRSSLHNITTERKDLFSAGSKTPLFIVIDEAQMAAEYLKFFRSRIRTDLPPVFREMVTFFQSTGIFAKIILSGTGLSMKKEDFLYAMSSKEMPNKRKEHLVFTDVGRFTRDDFSQEVYIRRYLTLSNDVSDRRLLERMMYWFSGRHRLTASLIEVFLSSENVPRHRVLTLFAEHLTRFKITDATELEAGEPPISHDLDWKIKCYGRITDLGCLLKEPEGEELIECLVDAFMRWTLRSELTAIPIESNMHDMMALAVGFLNETEGKACQFDPDVDHPVYISEPLVVLTISSLFEKQSWTTKKTWIAKLFRNAPNASSPGFAIEEALLLVLMEVFGGKFSPLADAFHCSESLGSRRATLVSLKCVADGVMQSCPVSWKAGSSDRLALRAKSPTDVLTFLDNPDGKAFLFPDNHMGPDLFCFLQDEETKELILLAIQSKASPTLDAGSWRSALNSVTPQFFYTVADGEQGQYARVSYPNLVHDLNGTLEMVLGREVYTPIVAEAHCSKLHSSTQAHQESASHSTRQTPRFLRIIATPNGEKARKHLKGKDDSDVAIFRWNNVKDYIGSTANSLVKTTEWVVV